MSLVLGTLYIHHLSWLPAQTSSPLHPCPHRMDPTMVFGSFLQGCTSNGWVTSLESAQDGDIFLPSVTPLRHRSS